MYNILFMHLDDLCIKRCFIIKVCFYLMLFIGFNSRKIFKAYYGFRVLYVFPFPSAGHGPTGSGRDNGRARVSLEDCTADTKRTSVLC